jgi:hypothetical protein
MYIDIKRKQSSFAGNRRKNRIINLKSSLIFLLLLLTGCATSPPKKAEDICAIFQQYPKWYWAAQESQKKWEVPISELMAIMYQESSFQHSARPPRTKLLGFIPWKRPSSAYGYSQSTNETWVTYKKSVHDHTVNRASFADAIGFIGWYADQAQRKLGIPKQDPYEVYLAYHEGLGGYKKGSFSKKPWLIEVAKKVNNRAWVYHSQLTNCQADLPKKHWWN